jgi:hypothetical protein
MFMSCGDKSDKSDTYLMKKEKNYHIITKYLKHKYDTKLVIDSSASFTKSYQEEVLQNKVVVIDSVVKSVKRVDDGYLLNVEVTSDKSKKIYASLKCSEELKEVYDNINHTCLLIAARITEINQFLEDYVSEDKSIDSTVVLKREEYLLYGVCEELVKKPDIYDFIEKDSDG